MCWFRERIQKPAIGIVNSRSLTRCLVGRRVQSGDLKSYFRISNESHPQTLQDNAMYDYHVLSAQRLTGAVRVASPALPKSVTLTSPGLEVMTDLRYVHVGVIDPQMTWNRQTHI